MLYDFSREIKEIEHSGVTAAWLVLVVGGGFRTQQFKLRRTRAPASARPWRRPQFCIQLICKPRFGTCLSLLGSSGQQWTKIKLFST